MFLFGNAGLRKQKLPIDSIIGRKNSLRDGQVIPDDIVTAKKKFLLRLIVQLELSGNLTFRTEKLIGLVCKELQIFATCTVLPRRVIVSFQDDLNLDATTSSSYTFSVGKRNTFAFIISS